MSGHSVINDDVMFLSIAPKMSTIATVLIGLLIFDEFRQKLAFGSSCTEEIKDRSKITQFDVELNEIGDVSILFSGIDPDSVGLEIEENR